MYLDNSTIKLGREWFLNIIRVPLGNSPIYVPFGVYQYTLSSDLYNKSGWSEEERLYFKE